MYQLLQKIPLWRNIYHSIVSVTIRQRSNNVKNMLDSIFFTHEFVTEHKFYLSQVGNRLREFPTAMPPQKQLRHGG